jgi:hypothetical protein
LWLWLLDAFAQLDFEMRIIEGQDPASEDEKQYSGPGQEKAACTLNNHFRLHPFQNYRKCTSRPGTRERQKQCTSYQ